MGTLEDLLKEYGLQGDSQEKVASVQKTNDEVEQVLESLGLTGAAEGVEKVANQNNNKGDRMGLTGIYEELFGEVAKVADTTVTEKTASAEENEATQLFGELTAHYFGAAQGQFMDKVAASLEEEAGAGEQPLAQLDNKSQLGATIGKPADPHMPVNGSASGGAPMQVMTGNQSPYSLKEMVLKKAILKRMQAAPVGAYKD